ncbi:MAG: flippase [Gemmatimonadota bacterium]
MNVGSGGEDSRRAGFGDGRPDVGADALARNTGLNALGLGLPLLVALWAIPVLVDGLGLERFGVLGIAWMILSVVSEVGFGRATTRFAAEALGRGAPEQLRTALRWTVLLQVVLGLGSGVALALATPWLVDAVLRISAAVAGEARVTLLVLAGGLPLTLVGVPFRGLLEAGQRFGRVNLVRTVTGVTNQGLPVAALAVGLGLPGVLAALIVSRAAGSVAYAVLAWRVYPDAFRGPGRGPGVGEIVSYGAWVTVSTVVSPILVYLDRFLLGALVSVTAVGLYTPAYELVSRLGLVPASIAATLFPAVGALRGMGREGRFGPLMARSTKYVLMLVGPLTVLAAVGADVVLGTWLGDAFTGETSTALRILALGVLVNAWAYLPFSLLQGVGRADVTGRIHLAELGVYAGVAWFLIRELGVVGAACAWTLRVTADALLLFVAARRVVPGSLSLGTGAVAALPRIAGGLAVVGGACAVALAGVEGAAGRWSVLVVAAAAMAVLGWTVGLDGDERARVMRLARPGAP